jgi:hypothetical protein
MRANVFAYLTGLELGTYFELPFPVTMRTSSTSTDGDGTLQLRQPPSSSRDTTTVGGHRRDVDAWRQLETACLRAFCSSTGIFPGETGTRTSACWDASICVATGVAAGWSRADVEAVDALVRDRVLTVTEQAAASEASRKAAAAHAAQEAIWEEERQLREAQKREQELERRKEDDPRAGRRGSAVY